MRDTGMRRPYGLIVLLIAMLVLISGIAVARPTWIELPQQAVEEGRDGGTDDDAEAEEDGFFPTLPTTGEGTAPGGDPEDATDDEPETGPPFSSGGELPTGPPDDWANGDGLDTVGEDGEADLDQGPPFQDERGSGWTAGSGKPPWAGLNADAEGEGSGAPIDPPGGGADDDEPEVEDEDDEE